MIEAIRKRRSVRQFKKTEISKEQLDEILRAAKYAPSAADHRGNYYIIIKNEKTKEAISKVTAWSGFAKSASVIIAVCVDERRAKRWVEDASVAAEHIILQAAEMELGSCWIQIRDGDRHEGDAEEYVRKLLSLPKEFRVLCIIPIGIPAKDMKPREDSDFESDRVYFEKFVNRGIE